MIFIGNMFRSLCAQSSVTGEDERQGLADDEETGERGRGPLDRRARQGEDHC